MSSRTERYLRGEFDFVPPDVWDVRNGRRGWELQLLGQGFQTKVKGDAKRELSDFLRRIQQRWDDLCLRSELRVE